MTTHHLYTSPEHCKSAFTLIRLSCLHLTRNVKCEKELEGHNFKIIVHANRLVNSKLNVKTSVMTNTLQ